MSVALTSPRPSVTIGDARGSVSIGTGRRSITLTSPAVVSITGVSSRVEIAAAPRVVTVGATQGIAGPRGLTGATGGLDLADHYGTMDTPAVLIDGGLL